ncbi:peptidase A4 family-domain-containing protein, partial [Butyriboletus roseoflavus]
TFNGVAGTVVVPTVSHPNKSSVVSWLALDGISCSYTTLGTGVSIAVDGGRVSYTRKVVLNHTFTHISPFPSQTAWIQWWPHVFLQLFPDSDSLNISAGDTLNINVTASSPTSGTVTIQNLSNGQVASKDLISSTPLCEQDVQWSVADYGWESGIPLADFGTLTYTNAHATGENIWFSPFGGNITDMRQNGTVLTNTTTGETSVTIKYQ